LAIGKFAACAEERAVENRMIVELAHDPGEDGLLLERTVSPHAEHQMEVDRERPTCAGPHGIAGMLVVTDAIEEDRARGVPCRQVLQVLTAHYAEYARSVLDRRKLVCKPELLGNAAAHGADRA